MPYQLHIKLFIKLSSLAIIAAIVLVTTSVWTATAASDDQAQPTLPIVTLLLNDVKLKTEIARTGNQRFMGLSFRATLAQDEGMLFVYPSEQRLVFTMRNTLLPLSIAFLSKDMVINEIHHMNVGPNQQFPANRLAQFALEVNQGWFEHNKIAVGTQIKLQ